jgi:hypothetical protein
MGFLSPITEFLERRRRNSTLMRRALAVVGPEFEQRSYEELTKPAEILSLSREFEGVELSFSAEVYETKANGDLAFCIDAGGVHAFPYPDPSYHFYKRKDGSVYY